MTDKPGAKALLAMKNMKSDLTTFKKPSLSRVAKTTKKKILTEEHYIQELSRIIQRDFFPDLEKLIAQNEYLEAKERNDIIKLRELYEKYSHGNLTKSRRSASESPATFDTPFTATIGTPNLNSEKQTHVDETPKKSSETMSEISNNQSLDSFLSTCTSEDNQSFQEIMQIAEEKLKQKFCVLYNAEKLSSIELERKLALPSIEEQFNVKNTGEIDTWKYTNKNSIMYIPDGVDFTEEEKLEFAKQKQSVEYANTRLRSSFLNSTHIVKSAEPAIKTKLSIEKVNVDGTIQENPTNSKEKYTFLKTPSPYPGDACSPLMTWGEIEGTPFKLDGSDTPVFSLPGPSFRIKETPRRECIALELAEKAGERMRNQKQTAIETARRNIGSPYIRSVIDRKMAMSPAARKLAASSKLGLRTSLMTPYTLKTPESIRKYSKSTTPLIRKKNPNESPIVRKEKLIEKSSIQNRKDLTDNLLNIPKRTKAADFF